MSSDECNTQWFSTPWVQRKSRRETQGDSHRHRHRHTDTRRHRHACAKTYTHTQTDKTQTEHTHTSTHTHTPTHPPTHPPMHARTHAGGRAGGRADRQKDRQTETDRHSHTHTHIQTTTFFPHLIGILGFPKHLTREVKWPLQLLLMLFRSVQPIGTTFAPRDSAPFAVAWDPVATVSSKPSNDCWEVRLCICNPPNAFCMKRALEACEGGPIASWQARWGVRAKRENVV